MDQSEKTQEKDPAQMKWDLDSARKRRYVTNRGKHLLFIGFFKKMIGTFHFSPRLCHLSSSALIVGLIIAKQYPIMGLSTSYCFVSMVNTDMSGHLGDSSYLQLVPQAILSKCCNRQLCQRMIAAAE